MNNKNDRPILEAALGSGEVVADILMKGDLLADIPLIGTAWKICRAGDNIRQRLFSAKLVAFIQDLDSHSQGKIDEIKSKIESSHEEAVKVGETLLMILEQITDMEKPQILARLFLSYIDGVISVVELQRIAQGINIAFVEDLKNFLLATDFEDEDDTRFANLIATGFVGIRAGSNFDELGQMFYVKTEMGRKLHAAHSHIPLL